jgi:hypothetical protein
MAKIKPGKNNSIALLAAIFNVAYINDQKSRGYKSLGASVQSVLTNNQFDIQTPLQIKTADEYALLFTAVFNNAAVHLTAADKKPAPQSVDIETNKVISFLEGNGLIKVTRPLTQHIY